MKLIFTYLKFFILSKNILIIYKKEKTTKWTVSNWKHGLEWNRKFWNQPKTTVYTG